MNHAEIEQLEHARRAAMLSCDVAALDTLTSAEMTWVHASAKVDDKQSFLEGFRTGRLRCFRLEHRETSIRVYGASALVSGIVDMEVAVEGERRSSSNRFSCLWVRGDADWQLACWQSTRIPPD
jgi:ketosteroid isomerase-like protein